MSLLASSIDTSGAQSLFDGFLSYILVFSGLLTAVGLCWLGYVCFQRLLGDSNSGMGGGKGGKIKPFVKPILLSMSLAWGALSKIVFSILGGLLGLGVDQVNGASGVSKLAATLVRTKTGI